MTKRTPKKPATEAVSARENSVLSKSTDPAFTKFTTYIRKTTHRAAKLRTVSENRELSELVEDLLSTWLRDNDSNGD